jgi:hypothetical protein
MLTGNNYFIGTNGKKKKKITNWVFFYLFIVWIKFESKQNFHILNVKAPIYSFNLFGE